MRELHPEVDLRQALDARTDDPPQARLPRGGVAHVTASHTVAQPGACWCGADADHDWPGRSTGAPHPRSTS